MIKTQVKQWATVLVIEQIRQGKLQTDPQHLRLASERTKTWLSSSDKAAAQKQSCNSCWSAVVGFQQIGVSLLCADSSHSSGRACTNEKWRERTARERA